MAVLKHGLLLAGCLWLWTAAGFAEDTSPYDCQRPLQDFVFSGYIQGRATGILWNPECVSGDLSTSPPPQQAGGEKTSTAGFHRVRFSLSTPLPWLEDFRLFATSKVDGRHAGFEDLYADYRPDPEFSIRLGLMKIPFGMELQTSSSALDTVERPLVCDFGNFGWADSLGMELAGSRSFGLRLDHSWEKAWAGLTPMVESGVFSGNGKNTFDSTPMQAMARLSLGWKTAVPIIRSSDAQRSSDAVHYGFTLGASGAYGRNKFDTRQWDYIPIGMDGNLQTHPQAGIALATWQRYEDVTTLGGDVKLQLADWTGKCEWVGRRFSGYTSQGYYATLLYDLERFVFQDLEWIMRWEEARQGYADGAHIPHRPYQAATLGFNWRPEAHGGTLQWRGQLQYIIIYLDGVPHQFHGSDLLIGQLQVSF